MLSTRIPSQVTVSIFAGLAAALFFAIASAAPPSSYVAFTQDTRNLIESGDVDRGEALHAAFSEETGAACLGCHGQDSLSLNPAWPSLAGQNAEYLYKQLQDFKYGRRINPNSVFGAYMASYANALNDQDMADLAVYYESLGGKAGEYAEAGVHAEDLSAAEQLARYGDGSRLIPSCNACHGAQGQGMPVGVPRLAGQNALYFEETMQGYKTGTRNNDVYGVMRHIVEVLSDDEIRQLAVYYAKMK